MQCLSLVTELGITFTLKVKLTLSLGTSVSRRYLWVGGVHVCSEAVEIVTSSDSMDIERVFCFAVIPILFTLHATLLARSDNFYRCLDYLNFVI